jgi:hypothetical protein
VKRTELLRRLADIAEVKDMTLTLVRHGANHDLYQLGGVRLTIARHSDIPEPLARRTIKDAENA